MTGRLIAPMKNKNIPEKAKWLSGEGGGAWFYISEENNNYRIKRYTPEGLMDCNRVFNLISSVKFDENKVFEIQHISHCAIVRVKQNGIFFLFNWIED